MFTAALYQWSVATCPVNIFLDIPLADRLRAAAIASEIEIGGFLVGHFEENKTIVTDFELVESEHRRGTAYSLSRRDDQHLIAKLNASRKRKRAVVGYFRSHLRPGMFLDTADDLTLRSHFNNPQQVALLVRPADDGTATGGFFFWNEGEMDRKETYLAFPLQSSELDSSVYVPAPTPTARAVPTVDTSGKLPSWLKIGLVAGAAAMGGYFFGSAGHQEHFGSRPGDITINAVPTPPPAAPKPASITPPEPAPSLSTPSSTPSAPAVAIFPAPASQTPHPPTKRPVTHPVADDLARSTPPPRPESAPAPQAVAVAPVPEPPPAPAFPHNPNPLPAPTVRTADASVDLEAVEDGGLKHVMHKIPLFGGTYRGGHDFHPAQVLRRTTPHVPAELARELTSEVPVDLKLKVDNTGHVSSVELLSRKSAPALVQLAGDAAYGWQFQPAQLKDRPVSSEVIVHFRFKPSL